MKFRRRLRGRLRKVSHEAVLVALVCAVAAVLPATSVDAENMSDAYRFKWPWLPGTGVDITGYPYTAHHGCSGGSCTDAYDFVTSGEDPQVKSSAEGRVIQRVDQYETPDNCYDPDLHLGNYVRVTVDNFDADVIYAHLKSVSAAQGATVYQGDTIGVQGCTGNTTGDHLHYEFTPSASQDPKRPDSIDGQSTKPTVPPLTSTNSFIGLISQEGAALRLEYVERNSWWGVGWTSDIEGLGTPGLFMRRPAGHAGWEQTFLRDPYEPYPFCSGESGIYAADLDPAAAYWVDICVWDTWHNVPASNLTTGTCPGSCGTAATGYPRSDMDAAYCPPELPNCTALQAFHFGYVWWAAGGTAPTSVACPDVDQNRYANIIDVYLVGQNWQYGTNDKRCDVNADTVVNILNPTRVMKVIVASPSGNPLCYQRDVPGGQSCPSPVPPD